MRENIFPLFFYSVLPSNLDSTFAMAERMSVWELSIFPFDNYNCTSLGMWCPMNRFTVIENTWNTAREMKGMDKIVGWKINEMYTKLGANLITFKVSAPNEINQCVWKLCVFAIATLLLCVWLRPLESNAQYGRMVKIHFTFITEQSEFLIELPKIRFVFLMKQ